MELVQIFRNIFNTGDLIINNLNINFLAFFVVVIFSMFP